MKTILFILVFFLLGSLILTAQINDANSHFKKAKYVQAIPLFEKAFESKDPAIKKEATCRLADCYRMTNNHALAVSWYRRVVNYADADPINYYYLGMALQSQSNLFDANRAFQTFEEKVPLDLRVAIYARYNREVGTQSMKRSSLIKQASRFFEQLKYSKAIPLYKKAFQSADSLVKREATIRLADCYRMVNDAKLASSFYERAVQYADVEPVNYYYMGMAYRSQANYFVAERAFSKYEEKVPTDFRAKFYVKYCHDVQAWSSLPLSADVKNAETLNSAFSDFGPYFYKDKLIIVSDRDVDLMNDTNYSWTNFGYLDLYSAQPLSNNDFWNNLSEPVKLSKIFNQAYHDGPASFTSDFKEIFTTRTLKSVPVADTVKSQTDFLKIYYADLSDEKNVTYTALPFNNDTYSVGHPAISGDGTKLIFSSKIPGGFGLCDLYLSERKNGVWSNPVNLGPELNTFGNEVFPFLANDTTLFFASDGLLGLGGLDLYQTSLVKGKWTTPWNLKQPINSSLDDFSIVFDKTLTSGFFSSNREGGKGSDDIYAFRNYQPVATPIEIPEEKPAPMISGYVKDEKTRTPLDSATVFLLNTATREVLTLKTNKDGYFQAAIDKGVKYLAKAMKPNCFNDCLNFTVSVEDTVVNHKTPRDLLLGKYALNQVFVIDNIFYDLNKWLIRDDAKPALDKLVNILKQYPINVELGSHTDSRASFKYNITLSQKRANAAVDYLIASGIDARRLSYKGYGESMLINRCADGVSCTEAEHQANRRTEFKITSIGAVESKADPFNPNMYKTGDRIQEQMLEPEFFKNCLEQ
jgi:outer membrane protein OmpA-like peptidoglycan-associated protein/tetratricopeptide (TPR) repeat protein